MNYAETTTKKVTDHIEGCAEEVARKIEAYSRKHGLSKTEFAKMAGVSYDTINNISRRKLFTPSLDTIARLAVAMELTAGELLDKPKTYPQLLNEVSKLERGTPA